VQLRDVVKHYRTRGRGTVHAMDGVNLDIPAGSTLGLVGESGCGKSTTARLLVQLERPTSGSIVIDGIDLGRASAAERRRLRRTIQMVFQDPYASLDPRVRVGEAIAEVLAVHRLAAGARRRDRVVELLEMVGLPASAGSRFPHELSGGQRQRIGIARALAVQPKVLVLDEAVSALDVSVRAEVMNLLARLRRELGLTYLFISHDLGMVRHISDRIAVMYLGQIVEVGPWQPVSDDPAHPYTVALQSAVPVADPAVEAERAQVTVSGEVPDAAKPPAGCRFHPRCPLAEEVCASREPALLPFAVSEGAAPNGTAPERTASGDPAVDRSASGETAPGVATSGTAPDGAVIGGAHLLSCHVVQRERRGATELLAGAEQVGPP
jgi:oligopeptide/dipeptide ABC transporter ATP-binding protein